MTSITFTDFRSADMVRPFSLEDVWKRYAAWAGLHNTAFIDLFAASSVSVSGVSSAWVSHPLLSDAPPSFTLTYHKTTFRQAVSIVGSPGIDLLVGTDASGYPTIWNAAGTILQQVPIASPQEADVEVTVRQQVLDDTSTNIWLSATLTMNGAWVTSYTQLLTETVGGLTVGLAAYNTDVVAYTQIRIPELCETAEFGTLDPGEAAFSGLSRTIEGRYLLYFVRFDGSLRVWRKKARDSVLTLDVSVDKFQKAEDLTQVLTHVRMMGAYIWGEALDETLLLQYGHRFQELNNPMLLTEEECDTEAANSLKRAEEQTFGATFIAQHIPLLEPEDRIEVNGDAWIINDYNFDVLGGDNRQTYNIRRYVWGGA